MWSLIPHDAKTEDDGRALIREILLASADILFQPLKIIGCWFACMRSRFLAATKPWPHSARCSARWGLEIHYPGSDVQLVYQAPRCIDSYAHVGSPEFRQE